MKYVLAAVCGLSLSSCTGDDRAMTGSREVPQGREAVFDRVMDEAGGLPFEAETLGAQVRYVFTTRKGDPSWSQHVGNKLPFADTFTILMEPQRPTSVLVTYRVNGDAIVSGLELKLEEVDEGRTRVHYSVIPASGPRSEGYTAYIDDCRVSGVLTSLGNLDRDRSEADKAEEVAATDRCTEARRALPPVS